MEDQIREKIFDLLRKFSQSDIEICYDSMLSNLDISYIDFAKLLGEIEDEYDLFLAIESMSEFETVKDFCENVIDLYNEVNGERL